MLSRSLPAVRRAVNARPLRPVNFTRPTTTPIRCASQYAVDPDVADPNMNGGYENPPRIKRSLRDPYGDWWDKQERRNFGEPVHEDNDVLAIFTTEVYNHKTAGEAGLHFGIFVVALLGFCGIVYQYYPDSPTTHRTFTDGLETELGGPKALLARKPGEEKPSV